MGTVVELLQAASKLDHVDRLELVSSLLEEMDPKPHYVSDDEARKRLDDLVSGQVQSLPEADFWRACGRD